MYVGDEDMNTQLERNELSLWIQLIFDLTGIALSHEKEYLIRERLHCLLEKYRCSSLSHLYFMGREEKNFELREDIIDQITTKETSFFRDVAPFEALRHSILPELLRRCRSSVEKRPLKIWSAACSTGQEVYSIAMLLHEIGAQPSDYRITATDISRYAIDVAKKGCYSHFEVERGVPPHLLDRFFSPGKGSWQVREQLKESLTFQRLSLHRPFVLPEKYDLIICRNVAIYFSSKDRENLFFQLSRHLQPDGYLLIGSTETARDLGYLFMETCLEPRATFLQPSLQQLKKTA